MWIKNSKNNIHDIFIGPMLCICGAQNDLGSIKFIMKNNINISEIDHDNANILHLASANNSINLVKYILERYNNQEFINKKDRWGNTPLHEACINENYEIADLLNKHKAKLLLDKIKLNSIISSLIISNKINKIKLFMKYDINEEHLYEENILYLQNYKVI